MFRNFLQALRNMMVSNRELKLLACLLAGVSFHLIRQMTSYERPYMIDVDVLLEKVEGLALIHQGKLLAMGTPHEVKQLMKGTILEVRLANPRRATCVLREQLAGHSVGLFGDRVHVVTREPEETARRIESALAGAGLKPEGVRPIEPSLEDVFVSVLGEGGEARQDLSN
mgnify:CR=1 FL=1